MSHFPTLIKSSLAFVSVALFGGCGDRAESKNQTKSDNESQQARPVAIAQPVEESPKKVLPSFSEKDMNTPVCKFAEYQFGDVKQLPNCLDVLAQCAKVTFDGKTSEQFATAARHVARKPCRVVLKLVDVSAKYDYADFELLNDDGMPAIEALKQIGDLGNYSRHIKEQFAINDAKKKGLDSKRLPPGAKVVLVGLGELVDASSWGAASPTYGVPRGDTRQIMLRGVGKPNKYHAGQYELAFMVRNWYFAAQ